MPKTNTYKSRVSKSANKKNGFRFRWWMGLVLVIVVAIVGVVVLRFSRAASVFTLNCQTQQCSNGAPPPAGYTSLPQIIYPEPGKPAWFSLQASSIFGPNDGRASTANIKACYIIISSSNSNSGKRFRLDIQSDNGSAGPQEGVIYGAGTYTQCITRNVGEPADNNRYLTFNLFADTEQLGLAQVVVEANNTGGQPSPVPSPAPSPAPQQQQCVNGSTGTVTCGFPAGTLVSTCGYRNVNGYALVCPQGNWNYIGTGDVNYNLARQRGATHEHDVGYWQQGNFCAVKSRITSEPRLDFQSPNHFYLVGCPPASAFKSTPSGWSQSTPPTPKGRLYITKYGPNGPMPPNARFKSSPSATPGNTGICVKNNENSTFACEGKNPWSLDGLFVSGSPYRAYFTVPNNWKLTRVLVNHEQLRDPSTSVQVNIRQNSTTYVDLYFDPK